MSVQHAAARWQSRQARLLAGTYQKGWTAGIASFQGQYATPPATAARTVPAQAPAQVMSRGLAPALTSLATMGAQIAALIPTAHQLAIAPTVAAAELLAVQVYLRRHGWRLGAGASAAWAGEMAGYAHAADAAGLSLEWELDPRAEHCDDCPLLAALPPLPLNLWPTLPGEGATDCSVGCRCSLRAVAAPAPSLTAAQHETLSRVGNRRPVLIAA